jgi:hypothetical protein
LRGRHAWNFCIVVFAHWPESNVLPLIHDEEHQLDQHPAVVIAMAISGGKRRSWKRGAICHRWTL